MKMDRDQSQYINAEGDEGERAWVEAAYEVLISSGAEKIRISTLSEKLNSTRTAFYWYFTSREALLEELVKLWQIKNTDNFIAKVSAYAESINEAVFNMFDCWLDRQLFDAPFDLAIRNWAGWDDTLAQKVKDADDRRINALIEMFKSFGYTDEDAYTRAHTVYYTQIGYISMMVADNPRERVARMPQYVEVYTGQKPTSREVARFMARHKK